MIIRCTVKNQFLEIFPNDSENLVLGFNHGGVEGKLHCCCLMEIFNLFKNDKNNGIYCTRLTPAPSEVSEQRKASLKSKWSQSWQLQSKQLMACLIIYLVFMSNIILSFVYAQQEWDFVAQPVRNRAPTWDPVFT